MRPDQRYQQLARVLDSSLSTLIGLIYGIDLPHRKILLKACRIQGPFSTTSRFYIRYKELLLDRTYTPFLVAENKEMDSTLRLNIWNIISSYSNLFADPVCCGYISMLLRYFPYLDYTSCHDELEAGIRKEVTASQGGGKKAEYLNHRSSFVVDRFHPYRPGFAPDWSIGARLRGGARRLSKTPLVPRLGNKNIPLPLDYDVTYRPYELANNGKPIRTLRDVERVFYKTGVELYGGTVMKTVWRGNDLKPRVYYSRGPSLHRASVYIQTIFNAFVDSLEDTHRHLRHNTSSLKPERDEILAIYDYSSFTSLLSEITRFTSILADEFMETFVTIIDPHHGPIEESLGYLLHEYNETCNRNPVFDASEVLQVEEAVFRHNCGMLGVPGNISSCTLLHGIHLSILVHSVMKNKVVGDDAIYHAPKDKDDLIRESIRDLGDVAIDKMESWEHSDVDEERIDDRFDYKKRPINRVENTVLTGDLVDFPALTILGILNPMHRNFPDDNDTRERKAVSRICRFFDVLSSHTVSEIGQHIVRVSCQIAYKMLGWQPGGGKIGRRQSYPPIMCEGLRYFDWIQHFSEDVVLRLPVQYINRKRIPDTFNVGQVFYQRSTALVSYFVSIGCIMDQTEYEYVIGKDLVDYYGRVSPRLSSRPVYKYQISDDLPYWFAEYFVSLESSALEET